MTSQEVEVINIEGIDFRGDVMRDQRVHNFSLVASGIAEPDATVNVGTAATILSPFADIIPGVVQRQTQLEFQLRITSARLLDPFGNFPKRAFLRILGFTAPTLEFGTRITGSGNTPPPPYEFYRNSPRKGGVLVSVFGWSNLNQGSLTIQQNGEDVSNGLSMTVPMNTVLSGDSILELDPNALSNSATIRLNAIGKDNEVVITGTATIGPQPARFINDDALNLQLVLMYDEAESRM
jgi:hypothetical protein